MEINVAVINTPKGMGGTSTNKKDTTWSSAINIPSGISAIVPRPVVRSRLAKKYLLTSAPLMR